MSSPEQTSASAASGTGTKPSSWMLGLRIASGALFVPLLYFLARAGGLAFWYLIALEVTLGSIEFYRMMRGKGYQPFMRLGVIAGLGVLWAAYRPFTPYLDLLLTGALMLMLALALRRRNGGKRAEDMAVTGFGVLYVGWLSAHLVLLRELPWHAGTSYAEGASYVFLAFMITWGCDTGAYAVGRLLGRTPLWAAISPRKTVEGSIGGLTVAVAAAFIARAWFAPYLSATDALVLGLLVGVFAQVGDLVESLLKRDSAAGDSSDTIPGHGGILDRFDSLYFGAPVVLYYLKIVVFGVL